LQPFASHRTTKNIDFNDSVNVIKPPQRSSAIYGAPPFTRNPVTFTTVWFSLHNAKYRY